MKKLFFIGTVACCVSVVSLFATQKSGVISDDTGIAGSTNYSKSDTVPQKRDTMRRKQQDTTRRRDTLQAKY